MKMGRTPGAAASRCKRSGAGLHRTGIRSPSGATPDRVGNPFPGAASVRIARVLKSSAGCLCSVPLGGFFHVLGGVGHAELHGPHTQLFDGESGKRLIPLQVVQRGL